MGNFIKDEEDNWQNEVRGKIEDLVEYREETDGEGMNSFAITFIESMEAKLRHREIEVSPKQYDIIWDLWDKYMGEQ